MWRGALILLLASSVLAGELTTSSIVKTIRFHPDGEPARIGLGVLSRLGEPGWKTLSGILAEYRTTHPRLARAAAGAFAEGPEKDRLGLVASSYKRIDDPEIRAILVVGLAYGYEDHTALLLKHMRENRLGALEILRILAPRTLPEQELRRYLSIPDLARVAYDALLGRGFTVHAKELQVWARAISRACLDRDVCAEWAAEGDFLIYEAVALGARQADEDTQDGAHCLLLTLSGKKLLRDPTVWRSWVVAQRDLYKPPAPDSPGHIDAAVVRGARVLREDLLDDGRCIWRHDPSGHWQAGSTSLAILALRAAGYPRNHPAIEKAVRSSMLLFGPRGQPALPAFPSRKYETYNLALLAMALCDLDPKRYRVPLQALHQRLVVGLHPNGMWGYQCVGPTDTIKRGRGDNSISQYAVLGLRSLHRAGFKVEPEVWQTVANGLRKSVHHLGGWFYHRGVGGRQVAMTAAGISNLAIAMEGLDRHKAPERIRSDKLLARARIYLGQLLMERNFGGEDLYAYYGVERAMVLTGTLGFRSQNRSYDWYARGVRHLLDWQHAAGFWDSPVSNGKPVTTYGRALDTSYAILFLTKATRTIGASNPDLLPVKLDAKFDQPEPPPAPPEEGVVPEPPPPPPELRVDREIVTTRDGGAVLRGVLATPEATLTLDGEPVSLDARGRFLIPVTINTRRRYRFVARGADGLPTTRDVTVEFDKQLPRVELFGPSTRHVGKQVVIFRADEPLRSLQVAGRVYPADGRVVRAAIEVGEGRRELSIKATDLAGNESRNKATIEAVNRVLVLDGQSAVGVDLRRPLSPPFTVECWVRGEVPGPSMSVVANTEGSGLGIFWLSRGHPHPYALVRDAHRYVHVDPKQPWNWSAWTHLAFTFDGKLLRYFVNGSLQGEAEGEGYRASGHRLFIGGQPNRHNWPEELFVGAIDEVRISSVLRYTREFKPEKYFMRDRETRLLVHFDRETVAAGVLLDDSGTHHHLYPHAQPAQIVERRP